MATEETLASWLRRELRSRKWNYGDLAERAGVSRASISRWANGVELPTSENARKLADALDAKQQFVLILAGHLDQEEPFPPDDPRTEITQMLHRIDPRPDRLATLKAILRDYLETDRDTPKGLLVHAA